jgi:hypothetical protein
MLAEIANLDHVLSAIKSQRPLDPEHRYAADDVPVLAVDVPSSPDGGMQVRRPPSKPPLHEQ